MAAGVRVIAFDEMRGSDGEVRTPYAALSSWLGALPPDLLEHRRREAELIFRRIGITFAVYGEAESTERLIPFDVIPRILAAQEWDAAAARPRAARQGAQRLYQGRLQPARHHQGAASFRRTWSSAIRSFARR